MSLSTVVIFIIICSPWHISIVVATRVHDNLVRRYFEEGFSYNSILCFLLAYHGVCISLSTLKRIFRRLQLRRRGDYSQEKTRRLKKSRRELQEQCAQDIHGQLNPQLQRSVELAQEKGSSAWLTVLPVAEHGFLLHKGDFRDALCLRYGWNLRNTPILCNCGTSFSVDHAMICHMGGIPTIRHNEIRDITATLLTEICHNVATEPPLQPLTNESFVHRTANTEPNARLDIRARGFWNTGQDAFFDVRVFYPNASSNRSMTTTAAYRKHESAKKREYAQRVREVEHGVFTPLVLSATGGMGREAITFYKRLADGISRKERKEYSVVMGWIRCRLSFAILRSAILCIRGSRSSRHRPVHELNIALATSE